MNPIIDIVNRDIVNLENCEDEPIHIPGTIQPHGFLMGLKKLRTAFYIDFCSENSQVYFDTAYTELLGKRFSEAFDKEAEKAIAGFIKKEKSVLLAGFEITLKGRAFNCFIHKSGATYIFEGESKTEEGLHLDSLTNQTQRFMTYMQDTHTLKELCQAVAQETRQITGYDRVMIYRFDDENNGEVYSEAVREDLEPFLGLHYPHTDIPAQARALYMRNLLRVIVDVGYKPVPIYTLDDQKGKNLDLGLAVLRSTSPIHVQYLQNMGVSATLTISLIHDNRLWGLVACHHYAPKPISPNIRLAAQLQGHFITSQIEIRERNENFAEKSKSIQALNKIQSKNRAFVLSSIGDIIKEKSFLEVCNATGASIYYEHSFFSVGILPGQKKLLELLEYIIKERGNKSFSTQSIKKDITAISKIACKDASGLLYEPLGGENNCVVWFRKESLSEIETHPNQS